MGGLARCALALGFEKMEKGSLGVKYTDRTNPIDKHLMTMFEVRNPWQRAWAEHQFGSSAIDYVRPAGSGGESLLLTYGQTGRRSRAW